jgi:peptide/nickel transport system substrate-binding protein
VEASLVSPAALDNPDLDVRPVGSGPYVAREVKIGDSVTYERREGYWDADAQMAKTITIRGVPDDNARLNALRSGQIDLMLSKVGQYDQASKLGTGFGFFAYPPSQVYAMYLNVDRPAVSDPRVRQALNFAVDREGISKSLLDGQCTPVGQPIPEPLEGSLSDPPIEYTYDPDRARQLLTEAGAENVTINALVGAGFSPQNEIGAALRAQFADVGVTLAVSPVDVVEAVGRYAQGNEDAMIQVRVQSTSAADSLARNYTNPRQFPGTVPPALPAALAPAYDPNVSDTDRTAALEQASAVITEDALDVFVCGVATQFAFSDRVIGVDNMGVSHYSGVFDLRYVGIAG